MAKSPISKAKTVQKSGLSLVTVATDKIRDRILALALAPGMQLDETILRDTLGISRTPAREALNRLVTEGLVEVRASKGFFVRSLDLDEIARLFDAYLISELSIASLCRFTHPNLAADLRTIQEHHRRAVENQAFLEITATNAAFHTRIADATDNSFLIEFSRRIHNYARRLAYFSYSWESEDQAYFSAQQTRIVEDHNEIIDRVEQRDRDGLIEVVTLHSELFRTRIARFIQGQSTSEILRMFRPTPPSSSQPEGWSEKKRRPIRIGNSE